MGVEMQAALRPAGPADEPFLRAVYGSTRLDELALVPWTSEQKAAFIDMQFLAQRLSYLHDYPKAETYVIEHTGQPAGRMIVDRSGDELMLMDIALLPEFRNAGIGTALLQDLLREADRSGRAVRLYVEDFNPAMRLYQRLGFLPVGRTGIYWEMVRQPRGAPGD